MRVIIYPYKIGSASAKLLATALDAKRVRPDGPYLPRRGDFIVNWGSSTIPGWNVALRSILSQIEAYSGVGQRTVILNKPENVALAANKLATFRALQDADVATPEWTTDPSVAAAWISSSNQPVYVRHKLTGHSGNGIQIVSPGETIPRAPLYVKNIQNYAEYRVHVFNGDVIDYVKKRRHRDDEPTVEQSNVRNLANGWVYSRQNLRRLDRVEDIAIRAVEAIGLDFGAVDVIMDEQGDVYVLEVNTACGLADTTLQLYVDAINNLVYNNASI